MKDTENNKEPLISASSGASSGAEGKQPFESSWSVPVFNDEALASLKRILEQVEKETVDPIASAKEEEIPLPPAGEGLIDKQTLKDLMAEIIAFPSDHVPRDVVRRILQPLLGDPVKRDTANADEVLNNKAIKTLETLLLNLKKRN